MAGDYAVYIWSAYGVAGLAVLALVAWTYLDLRAQTRALERLEAGRRGGAPGE